MISKNMLLAIKRSFTIKKYPTADRNAHPLRLMRQALPYYFIKNGFSFPPLSAFIHVNSRCNLKCKMCDAGQDIPDSMFYQNLKGGDKNDLPLEDFKHIIDELKPFKPFIGIPALEPLIYPYIIQAVQYIRFNNLRCSLATNGTLLKDMAEGIVKSGLSKIIVSLDGIEKIHDSIRGAAGTYKKVLEGINALHRAKLKFKSDEPYIFINYVISEENQQCITEFIDDLPIDSITQIDFRVMFFCTNEVATAHNKLFGDRYDATTACLFGGIDLTKIDANTIFTQIESAKERHQEKCKFFFNHGREGLHAYYHDPEIFLDSTNCVFPWYTIQINHNGDVIPPQRCYHNIFGNILRQSFKEIWNGEPMKTFRKDLQNYGRFPACTRCEGINY